MEVRQSRNYVERYQCSSIRAGNVAAIRIDCYSRSKGQYGLLKVLKNPLNENVVSDFNDLGGETE